MMYRAIILFLFFFGCDPTDKDVVELPAEPFFEIKQIATLESGLIESSGLETINGQLFTHSDDSGKADLIQINMEGTITQTLRFNNVTVKDWEDVAVDQQSFYIADIGNNLGNREDLRIFKLAKSQMENPEATAQIISFSFNDQTSFGDGSYNQTSYDVEALAILENQLYVFTKDWINKKTNVYSLPKNAGNYPLDPLTTLEIDGLVTGATTNPAGKIILCGYSQTLSPFVAQVSIEDGIPVIDEKKDLSSTLGGSQIEGITYSHSIEGVPVYYLTSEEFKRTVLGQEIEFPATLYELKWNR